MKLPKSFPPASIIILFVIVALIFVKCEQITEPTPITPPAPTLAGCWMMEVATDTGVTKLDLIIREHDSRLVGETNFYNQDGVYLHTIHWVIEIFDSRVYFESRGYPIYPYPVHPEHYLLIVYYNSSMTTLTGSWNWYHRNPTFQHKAFLLSATKSKFHRLPECAPLVLINHSNP